MTAHLKTNAPFRILILGGGVSGLSAAHTILSSAKNRNVSVTLLESTPRFGGWVNTKTLSDGCVFELGPRTIRPVGIPGRRTLALVSELGLIDKIVPVTNKHPSISKRYIYAKGKVNLLPNKLTEFFTRQSPLTKPIALTLLKEPFQPKSMQNDETVHEFFKRRLGDEIADYFVDALCYGIYASSAKELSMATCFPSLVKWEKDHGSMMMGAMFAKKEKQTIEGCPLFDKSQKERWRTWTLRNGLQELIDKWLMHLNNLGLKSRSNTPCKSIEFTNDKKVLCHSNSEIFEADHVISSLSSIDLTKILPKNYTKLKDLLHKIPAVSVAVVNLEFKGNVLSNEGFGYLVPSCELMQVLGVVFDSCVFDNGRGNTKLTVMMGGSNFKKLFGNPDNVDKDYLLHVALKNVKETLGIDAKPSHSMVSVQKNCIPQYKVGHLELVDAIHKEIRDKCIPLTLVGSSYKAVSLNDCIYNSQIEIKKLIKEIER